MDSNFDEGIRTAPIVGFENYVVTSEGQVINLNTGREMMRSPNQNGDLSVGLMRGGIQFRRSVRLLVAENFVEGKSIRFNTPILLNGDREDLRASNIVWRPRWFAMKYQRQFTNPHDWYFRHPVVDIKNGWRYESIYHAGISNGILFMDIFVSIQNGASVFPTGGRFEYI